MSILDDAIREHLELKRAHGADDAELKKLEDEAFGPPGRPDDPDPFAEAPTEFLTSPATDAGEAAAEAQAEPAARRAPNIADEEQPAVEQQTIPVPRPEIDAGHSTEERQAIAEQPTEMFDVEADLGGETESQSRSPSDEELVDSQIAEPRLAPFDPLDAMEDTGPDAELAHEPDEEEEDDDFFSEQRLSDELNKALEAPVTDEHLVIPAPDTPGPATDEHAVAPTTDEHLATTTDEHLAPTTDEHEREPLSTDEHDSVQDTGEQPATATTEEGTAVYQGPALADPKGRQEDLLEDTPDFLEDAPEDDNLWFEQKPPKDFDFDD